MKTRRLGAETIDLYYQHRVDPTTPTGDAVGAMADLVRVGKRVWSYPPCDLSAGRIREQFIR